MLEVDTFHLQAQLWISKSMRNEETGKENTFLWCKLVWLWNTHTESPTDFSYMSRISLRLQFSKVMVDFFLFHAGEWYAVQNHSLFKQMQKFAVKNFLNKNLISHSKIQVISVSDFLKDIKLNCLKTTPFLKRRLNVWNTWFLFKQNLQIYF